MYVYIYFNYECQHDVCVFLWASVFVYVGAYLCVCIYIHTYINIYIHTYIYIYIYIHIYAHRYTYIYTCVCMYTCFGGFFSHTHAPLQIGMESVTITLSVSTTDEGLERALQGRNSQNSKYTTQNDCRSVL